MEFRDADWRWWMECQRRAEHLASYMGFISRSMNAYTCLIPFFCLRPRRDPEPRPAAKRTLDGGCISAFYDFSVYTKAPLCWFWIGISRSIGADSTGAFFVTFYSFASVLGASP